MRTYVETVGGGVGGRGSSCLEQMEMAREAKLRGTNEPFRDLNEPKELIRS